MTAVALAFPDDGDDQTPPGAKSSAEPIARPRPEARTTPPANRGALTSHPPRAGSPHGSSQSMSVTHGEPAAVAEPAADQTTHDTLCERVGGAPRPPAPATQRLEPRPAPLVLVDPLLILAAQALDDLEATRIANENRLRSLRDVYGLAGSRQEAEVAGLVDGLKALEHQAELSLKRALRKHPLGPWVACTVGVGEKQGARLLAAIGDPYWNTLHDRPRTVSELWAYCGYHVLRAGGDTSQGFVDPHATCAGVAPARARGQRANWSADAKSRVWLIACSCIKQAESPYRAIYDDGRARYDDALHPVECRRCGPSGHPAAVGTPLSAGHQHARALRLVSKAVLRDLWLEARALHEPDQD